jgi:sulfate adenylyltransferase
MNASRASPSTKESFCVFFTGLSGAGKTTLAFALDAHIRNSSARPTTLLDGDGVRMLLSSELGFSREHRDLNIRRIGYVASEIVKHGGIVIASAIAPFDAARKAARNLVLQHGTFYLIHVATPLDVCEARDTKGLYAKARAGTVQHFTGVSDPYEAPGDAEIVIDTAHATVDEATALIVKRLRDDGVLA